MTGLRLEAFGVGGLPEVTPGADLAALLLDGLRAAGTALRDGDVIVVSSKIVSKAEGRAVAAPSRDQAVAEETVRVLAERITARGPARIVQARCGPVLAAAGVDASNVAAGTVLKLPADPDASARALRAGLAARTGRRVGVVLSDTLGRPWRLGQADAAIGAAGITVVDDLRGAVDSYGHPLEVTIRAVADEVAALADLVKGKLGGVPAAVVRGLASLVTDDDGPGAAALLRPAAEDWFRLGHLEAVRAGLGVPAGSAVAPVPMPPGGVADRLRRAVTVALAVPAWPGASDGVTVTLHERDAAPGTDRPGTDRPGTDRPGTDCGEVCAVLATAGPEGLAGLGAVTQRLLAAAWAEDLDATVAAPEPAPGREPNAGPCGRGTRIVVRVRLRAPG